MRNAKKPRIRIRDWCPGGGEPVGGCERTDRKRISKRMVRCQVCGQRFETYNVDTEPMDAIADIHRYIPRHKATLTPKQSILGR